MNGHNPLLPSKELQMSRIRIRVTSVVAAGLIAVVAAGVVAPAANAATNHSSSKAILRAIL